MNTNTDAQRVILVIVKTLVPPNSIESNQNVFSSFPASAEIEIQIQLLMQIQTQKQT